MKKQEPLAWEVNGQKVPITKDTIWYHGSPTAKLKPGDVLLPPSKTQTLNWQTLRSIPEDRDTVFITPDINQAVIYASGPDYEPGGPFIAGAVYAVKPRLPIIPDPERPGSQFRTPRAIVRQVVIPAVTEEQVIAAYKRDYWTYMVPELREHWQVKAAALLAALEFCAP